ncbi:MAG: amidohydrolase family protein [Sedimentisphaerales bacterium]|nr:amidohydrolase family protein [Sedimentisphaerales bacterium]
MQKRNTISRRTTLKGIGSAGALALLGGHAAADQPALGMPGIGESDVRKTLFAKIFQTPLIDTHEHLIEESERLQARRRRGDNDDWSFLLSHYLDSDLLTCGMPQDVYDRFFSADVDPVDKWKILEPYWPHVRSTGYGMAVEIAVQQLYDVPQLSKETVKRVAAGYDRVRKKGFYHDILRKQARIESCQVNCLSEPFKESEMPQLLMQDISIIGMLSGPNIDGYAKPAGIEVKTLSDWYRVMDWWFAAYGPYAVAVKSQHAYGRDIDHIRVPAEAAEPIFAKRLEGKSLDGQENKTLQDHLFWCAVDKAAAAGLPVKLHTGYYAGQNSMPLSRLIHNPGSATALCRAAPDAQFVFMHICYPYYEEILSVAKQWTNAYIDMCWSWIINPVAAKDFLKKYLVTAPANKILTFGGDYIPVEPVLGHAVIARRGIALALSELVEEGWITLDRAVELTDKIMHQNARELFHLEEKAKRLKSAPWAS